MFVFKIFLCIILNLMLINLLLLDLLNSINESKTIISNIQYLIHNQNMNIITYKLNNTESKKNHCTLYCKENIEIIKNFYDGISQFKGDSKLIPIKIIKTDNNKCRIIYYRQLLSNNNLIREDRIFNFDYYMYDNNCNWYIIGMSPKLN